ncbi:sodium:solute symporter family protein [Tepidibacter hydrothermalis]|uniref:Sodium:solute symporter family protein n=1 Tax=Tepidibacter hydrothermalis TaxID=3036126 RepID=A0ABY8EH93_9FIRM|nr:sodium:solute symporter family protein [Tepidibacter hydrothermalis]WFD12296.1 sodium:solute symporter family protein [Tepidibacter hydrothermalis]
MLTLWENGLIIICALIFVGIGYYFSKNVKDMESYYLGNRSLPWSLIVGTLVASWYGGVGTVGSVEYAAIYGISAWAVWSIAAHIGRMPLALWVGPKIHIRTDITVPDLLESFYGKHVALLGAVLMFIYCAQLGEITAMGIIGEVAWGIDKQTIGLILVSIVVILTVLGGFMGVAVTDMILFFCMVFGLTMIMPQQFEKIGGFVGLTEALKDTPQLMHPTKGMSMMKALMLIVYSFGAYSDPTFYQRFSAANSPKVGRRALLTCFSLWICFDIVLVMTGLIVRATYPDMPPAAGYITLVLSSLPKGIRVLFIIGILGSIISTLDSYYLAAGATLANDIYGRITKKESTQKQLVTFTRIGVVVAATMGLSVAFKFENVYDACLFVGSIWMGSAFVPIVGALLGNGRRTELGGLLGMLGGGFTFGYFKMFPLKEFELEPLVIAIPVSFIAWFIGNKIGKDLNTNNEAVTIKEN